MLRRAKWGNQLKMIEGFEGVEAVVETVKKATGAVNTMFDTAKTVRKLLQTDEVDKAELAGTYEALFKGLAEVREQHEMIKRSVSALRDEIENNERLTEILERYALSHTDRGAPVYELKPDDTTGEPPHVICPQCYSKKQRSFLAPHGERRDAWYCSACGYTALKSPDETGAIRLGRVRRPGPFENF